MSASGGAALGLSLVHTSQHGQVLTGDSPHSEAVPRNGWGKDGLVGPDPYTGSGGYRIGEDMGTVRRGLEVVSVGICPVLELEHKRGTIQRFTERSRSRMMAVLSDGLAPYQYMGTLTVGKDYSRDGRVFKKALDKFFQWFMKEQIESKQVPGREAIFWFLEFQKRGAPHVHFFYTCRVSWMIAAAHWSNCIEDPKVERVGTRFETLHGGRRGMLSYARKYANKAEQKEVPSDYDFQGRFWGVRGYRVRGTCHVTRVGTEGGQKLVDDVMGVCERARAAGVLRRIPWEYGQGFLYFPTDRTQTMYSLGIGQQIDVILMRLRT